jgi:hypothetical protein
MGTAASHSSFALFYNTLCATRVLEYLLIRKASTSNPIRVCLFARLQQNERPYNSLTFRWATQLLCRLVSKPVEANAQNFNITVQWSIFVFIHRRLIIAPSLNLYQICLSQHVQLIVTNNCCKDYIFSLISLKRKEVYEIAILFVCLFSSFCVPLHNF